MLSRGILPRPWVALNPPRPRPTAQLRLMDKSRSSRITDAEGAFHHPTRSVCPRCVEPIDTKIRFRGGRVVMRKDQEGDHGASNDDMLVAELQATSSPRKPTFLQKERWKAVQRAKLEGMSILGMAMELGIHRDTVGRYIDAGSPSTAIITPTRPHSQNVSGVSRRRFGCYIDCICSSQRTTFPITRCIEVARSTTKSRS